MGYIIGFDLDGCLANLDSSVLHYIDNIKDDTEHALVEERYYRNCDVRFNPRDFMHEDDKGVIITARLLNNPAVEPITRRWVTKNFPDFQIFFVGGSRPSNFKSKEQWDVWNDAVTERKIAEIIARKVDIYFDDSPSIVERLREKGITTIQLGGRL